MDEKIPKWFICRKMVEVCDAAIHCNDPSVLHRLDVEVVRDVLDQYARRGEKQYSRWRRPIGWALLSLASQKAIAARRGDSQWLDEIKVKEETERS